MLYNKLGGLTHLDAATFENNAQDTALIDTANALHLLVASTPTTAGRLTDGRPPAVPSALSLARK